MLSALAISAALSTAVQAAVLEPEADCPSVSDTLTRAQIMFAGRVLSTAHFGIVDIDHRPTVLGLRSAKSGLSYYVVTFEVLHTYKPTGRSALPKSVSVLETWRCEPCSIADARENAPAVGDTVVMTAFPKEFRARIPQLRFYDQVISGLSKRLPFALYEDILCNRFTVNDVSTLAQSN